jgi:hypothetical protein
MRRLVRAATTAVATAVLCATPAVADDESAGTSPQQQVGVSLDGVHYREVLERPLFGATVRWTPGDVRTSRFFVRQGDDQALVVDVVPGEVEDLFDAGRLEVEARAGNGRWRAVPHDRALRLAPDDLPDHRKVAVAIRVSLDEDAPASTLVRGDDFDVEAGLGDFVAPPVGSGERATWWVVPLGLLLLSGGAVLYARREAPLGDR